ncbi:MAG: hypothetical protein IPJ04_18010 [Candidatus Eisenbacteria bacterium]|nr:hypothetical protein [Candidatus Eisenbacteria bacterium]
MPTEAHVTLAVYDAQGRRVRLLADARLPAGEHVMRWEGDDDAGRALAAGSTSRGSKRTGGDS